MLKENFLWYEDAGLAVVEITDPVSGTTFVGQAMCSPEDWDMKSKLTGQEIAWKRAYIFYLQYIKNRAYIEYQTLNNLEKNVKNCKHYNKEFQIENLLSKQVNSARNQYYYFKERIKAEKKSLQKYIEAKAEIYQKIREGRNNKAKGE